MAAIARISEDMKKWRKGVLPGYSAQPIQNKDGSLNLMKWICTIPGRKGTLWEGGTYRVRMTFDDNFPLIPPKCKFDPPLFHPNVFPSGNICLSILEETSKEWKQSLTIKDFLLGIHNLLDLPNTEDTANDATNKIYCEDRPEYDRRVRAQAKALSDRDTILEGIANIRI